VLHDEVLLDRHRNIVQTEAEACKRKTRYLLKYPEKLIFVDEVGNNISQKGDDNAGGQTFMVATDMRAQVQKSVKVNHFTVLGFTAADGCPVVGAIIIVVLELRMTDVTGFNPLSKDAEDTIDEGMQVLEK
jgi:hypothetical protein